MVLSYNPRGHLSNCLRAVSLGGRRLPLFVLHGMQGDATFARLLAKRVENQYPVYAFEALGLDGKFPPLDSIEEMAAQYLAAMREVRRTGPYLLIGFCAGGYLALEMAHRLANLFQEEPNVVLVDTPSELDLEAFDPYLLEQIAIAQKRLVAWPNSTRHLAGAPNVVQAFGRAIRHYQPKQLKAPVCQVVTEQLFSKTKVGWENILHRRIVTRVVMGNRAALLYRRMPIVADFISTQVDAVCRAHDLRADPGSS